MTRVAWSTGGEAHVVNARGEALALVSTVPAPPGARLEGRLDDGAVLKVKVHGSKRQPDGSFRIEGRAIDLTRVLRERLERDAAPARDDPAV